LEVFLEGIEWWQFDTYY